MQRDAKSPQHYIDSIEGAQKELLLEIRALILEAAPESEEIIEYGMLGYTGIANLAAQKHYVSLYVAPKVLAQYKQNHPESNCGKSCLRFRSQKDFHADSVQELLQEVHRMWKNGESTGCC